MFANAKQRLKNETTQTLEDGPTDLISGTATDSLFFFFLFVSATGAANCETSVINGGTR